MSFPRYNEYQDTGLNWLGQVPTHWSLRRLGYYFGERREKVSDRDHQPLSVTKDGIVPQLETAAKTDDGDNRKKVCKGDFVINSRSDRKGSAGLSGLDGSVSLISIVLKPKESVHGPFVHHLLRCVPFQEEFYRFGKGIVADLWSTNYSSMSGITLAMPPLSEQHGIANFLDRETNKIDALIAEQQRLIELLQEKRQAVISHAVTKGLNPNAPMKDSGVEWLGQVPENWAVCAVGYRYEVRLGKMLDEKRVTGQHLSHYLRNTDVQWESINTEDLPEMDFHPSEHERYSLKEGDLLVCEGGEVGRSAIWQSSLPVCFYQKALHRLRPLNASQDCPRFQLYIMKMACSKGVFEASSGKATINHLPAEAFRRYRFAYPPFVEQQAISEHLSTACGEISRLQQEASSLVSILQERRSALISAAVTGQIDVRGLATEEDS